MRILITGHTGFKGAWLSVLLRSLGHEVGGVALAPRDTSISGRSRLSDCLSFSQIGDVRDPGVINAALQRFRPQVIFHLAAQALVLEGVSDPYLTSSTNVLGALNLMAAVGERTDIEQVIVVSTDKVYRNDDRASGYTENDCLGGTDPYSASKAAADILVGAWASSIPFPQVTICRAGNVIGGGDDSAHRLLPDVVRSLAASHPVSLRFPDAIRPWQHVLDCLWGYVTVMNKRAELGSVEAFNFGPSYTEAKSVSEVASLAIKHWGAEGSTHIFHGQPNPHEHRMLMLDSALARTRLGWQPCLDVPTAVQWSMDWERAALRGEDLLTITERQVRRYQELATSHGLANESSRVGR